MSNIESMISAQRIICIKRYLSTNPAGWKFFLKKVGEGGGGNSCFIVILTMLDFRSLFQNLITKNVL